MAVIVASPPSASRPIITDGSGRPPPGVELPPPGVLVFARPPSSFEQFRTYPDEQGLGLPTSTPEDLAYAADHLNFETGMVALAKLAAHVHHLPGNTRAQLTLAETVFGDDDLVARLTRFAQSVNFELEVFPPRTSPPCKGFLSSSTGVTARWRMPAGDRSRSSSTGSSSRWHRCQTTAASVRSRRRAPGSAGSPT